MASLRSVARNFLEEARDGIAWIAVYKVGRSWYAEDVWPDLEGDSSLSFCPDDVSLLRSVLVCDPNAILVNGYYCNLGPLDEMSVDTLSAALLWQYSCSYNLLASVI